MIKSNRITIFIIPLMVLTCFSFATIAQTTTKRIILLETMPVPVVLEHSQWFLTHLKAFGHIEGKNVELVHFSAEGSRQRAATLLRQELAKYRPDLVVTNATMASQEAQKVLAGTDIPILFFTVSDPVGAGLIKEVNRPTGTNVTGIINTVFRETKINLIIRLVGPVTSHRPIRFGYVHSTYPSSQGDIALLKKITQKREDVTFISCSVTYRKITEQFQIMLQEAKRCLKNMQGQADYLWMPLGPLGETEQYFNLLQQEASIPIVYATIPAAVKQGALISISPDAQTTGREAAWIADQILKGKNPGMIPVKPPSQSKIGINYNTVLKMKIVVPNDILHLAQDNIYR